MQSIGYIKSAYLMCLAYILKRMLNPLITNTRGHMRTHTSPRGVYTRRHVTMPHYVNCHVSVWYKNDFLIFKILNKF